jgi:hypothetical protein
MDKAWISGTIGLLVLRLAESVKLVIQRGVNILSGGFWIEVIKEFFRFG